MNIPHSGTSRLPRVFTTLFIFIFFSLSVTGQKRANIPLTRAREIVPVEQLLTDKNGFNYFQGTYEDTLLLIEKLLKCRRNKEINFTWAGYTAPHTTLPVA